MFPDELESVLDSASIGGGSGDRFRRKKNLEPFLDEEAGAGMESVEEGPAGRLR